MSRIHDALKKAEQDRVALQGGAAQSGYATGLESNSLVVAEAESSSSSLPRVESAGGMMPGLSSASSAETLLAQCRQTEWKPDMGSMLFMNGNDSAQGTEQFRTLRSRLYSLREKMTLKTVLVTSALPREGKSFTSANLAQVMVRQHGRRVLLIDADLRGPRLHLMLGNEPGPGLSDYLQGRNDEFSILQRGPMENLFFMPSGTGIEDPAELVANGRMKILLQRLGPLFDWIIVDSPPAIPVSDASVLATACDGVLIVVRSNSTPSDAARKARQEFSDTALLGVVLNGTNQESAPYERYYYETYGSKGTTTKGTATKV
jgi:protein-tyrosine kinase